VNKYNDVDIKYEMLIDVALQMVCSL